MTIAGDRCRGEKTRRVPEGGPLWGAFVRESGMGYPHPARNGLDVAWLASNSIVERIVLVTSDSDFIPAMKFARREGVQIVLITMGHYRIRRELKVHADQVREVSYP